jgi:hypothetical protein
VPEPAWAAVHVLSHEQVEPGPAPLHDSFTGQATAVIETKGQPSLSTVQVDCAPGPAQNVVFPVHEASVAWQTHLLLPVVPPQVWCVPQVLTVLIVTHDCASAVQVVTSRPPFVQ